MWKDVTVKGRTLGGVTDLTLLARVRSGFVPALDAVTYKTRVKRLLRALNAGRTNSHEYALLRPFSDAVERVGVIQSVRVAIVDPAEPGAGPDRLLLSVSFDGGAESYLRILWQKVGTLLDLIFCNTDGYVLAHGNRFEDWAAWVRGVQIETDFFYGMPGVTAADVRYLRDDAALRRRQGLELDAEALASSHHTVRTAESQAWAMAEPDEESGRARLLETSRQGFQSLVVLHRLAAMFLPGTPDGDVLQRAARSLLHEFLLVDDRTGVFQDMLQVPGSRFEEQIRWITAAPAPEPGKAPPMPTAAPPWPRGEVQAGIIEALPREAAAGRIALVAFASPAAAAALITRVLDDRWLTFADAAPAADRPWVSLAITHGGLRACGLEESELAGLPLEFRQGMAARASVLGDVRSNHPRRWNLPRRNWKLRPGAQPSPVELDTVHALVQMRATPPSAPGQADPLDAALDALFAGLDGVDVLAVESMARRIDEQTGNIVEHFGYADGLSGPEVDPVKAEGRYYSPQVRLGELLVGYDNMAEVAPDAAGGIAHALLRNGSFFVVRKLAQHVDRFRDAIADALEAHADLDETTLRAKLMGRYDDGRPLAVRASAGAPNDFNFDGDPHGAQCPLHAHVRRANPRVVGRRNPAQPNPPADPLQPPPGGRWPTLARRGMSYGPPFGASPPDAPRGLMFMAYNASLGEQFEVVQRWLSGGNSTGLDSSQSDPFLGVPENGQPREFRFEYTGKDESGQPKQKLCRMVLDGTDRLPGELQPLVQLEWGTYAFAPARSALAWLRARAEAGRAEMPWSVRRGVEQIARLRAIEATAGIAAAAAAWKALLEDPQSQEEFLAADVWAAIRTHHRGVLRTPYGVIVADRGLVQRVLSDKARVTVEGYRQRMLGAMGEIFLGLDDHGEGCPYRRQAQRTRAAIGALSREGALDLARGAAHERLDRMIDAERATAELFGSQRWELNLNLKELFDHVLQRLCEEWFGLRPEGREIVPRGQRWDWDPGTPEQPSAPTYPGHFMAPSRYIFQPEPGETVRRLGRRDGRALAQAFERMLARGWRPAPEALIGKAIVDDLGSDQALCARTLVGAIMGFVPTLDGALRLVMNEWLRTGRFWALRERLQAGGSLPPTAMQAWTFVEDAMSQAMHLRPSPELLWRTAATRHDIDGVPVFEGERLVVSLVSAMHQCLERGERDLTLVFGGQRGPDDDGPTHACPGYDAAVGAAAGVLTALLERTDLVRPSPAPLSLTLEGPMPTRPPAGGDLLEIFVAGAVEGAGRVVVCGDSWFQLFALPSLAQQLGKDPGMGFTLSNSAFPTATLELISGAKTASAVKRITDMGAAGQPLQAILLCGGGNNVTHGQLRPLVHAKGHVEGPLNRQGVQAIVREGFRDLYRSMITALIQACVGAFGKPVPIFLHGYDYPVPDGRRKTGDGPAWLQPVLEELGYTSLDERQAVMKLLIDELNAMQAALAAPGSPFQGIVFHAPLTGVLSGELTGDKYKDDWRDELHAEERGLRKLAARLVEHMAKVIPELKLPGA